jgi:hypothetical protein
MSASIGLALAPAVAGAATSRGVIGAASVDGGRLIGAKVELFARGARVPGSTRRPWFTRRLVVSGTLTTNAVGGFAIAGRSLPREYLVSVAGGTLAGRPFKGMLRAVGRLSERGVTVTPVTSLAARFLKTHRGRSTAAGIARIRAFIHVPKMPGGISTLGEETSVLSESFSPNRFMAAARTHGGLSRYVHALARKAARPHATARFAPRHYVPRRPFAPVPGGGGRRAQSRSIPSWLISTAFSAVVKNATSAALCQIPVAGIPAMFACAGTVDLSAIVDSLNDIESSLVDIQNQLKEIQYQLSVIENQNAQAAYQTAFTFAGINPVNDAVNASWSDANYINVALPDPQSVSTPTDKSNTAICDAAYPSGYIDGQDLQALCVDYLSQAEFFAAPQTPYYASLYQSLTGASNQPQNNLLPWTYQQLIDGSGQALAAGGAIGEMQDGLDQFGQLEVDAFTMLIAAEEFQGYMSAGAQVSCPQTTTTTYPANTPLNVVGICNATQTAQFELSVENYMSTTGFAAPPVDTVVDPRTNRIWWAYPVDFSATTMSSGTYPFYPGASETYVSPPIQPVNLVGEAPVPILADSPSYTFKAGNQADLTGMMSGLLVPTGGTLASALNSAGFHGLGTNAYGMTWQQVGTDAAAVQYATVTNWHATSANPDQQVIIDCDWSAYPEVAGALSCLWLGFLEMQDSYYGWAVQVNGVLASHDFSVAAAAPPTSSTTPSTCPQIYISTAGAASTISYKSSKHWVKYCTFNTFGLLVDTAAPAPGTTNGVSPPLFSLNQLTGPPPEGVPAIVVPPPS